LLLTDVLEDVVEALDGELSCLSLSLSLFICLCLYLSLSFLCCSHPQTWKVTEQMRHSKMSLRAHM